MSRVPFRALLTAPLLAAALFVSACGGEDEAAAPVPTTPAATSPAGTTATSPAAGGDAVVATTPGEIQNAVFSVLSIVETCWAGKQDYRECRSPEAIGNIGVNVVESTRPEPGEVAVTAATRDTFKIIGTAGDGNLYVLSKDEDGNVDRRCKLDAGGTCPTATW